MNQHIVYTIPQMKIISCNTTHLPAIRAIFNDAIVHSTALWEYQPRTLATTRAWFATKTDGGFPVIGIENEAGELMGFASYGVFRDRPCYKYSVENSVYVDARFRGKGIGALLLKELIRLAQAQDLHIMVGAIDTSNEASLALHRSLGFEYCGTVKQAGFKFGRWLDMALYQLILPTPSHPVDG